MEDRPQIVGTAEDAHPPGRPSPSEAPLKLTALLYPDVPLRRLPQMLGIAGAGALVAGAYGALHDQVSWAIAPEYFTRLKFAQFAWADLGLPPRARASEIGFLATWWVGLIAGWALCRKGFGPAPSRREVVRAFAIILGVAVAFGLAGALLGVAIARCDLSYWEGWRLNLDLHDVPAFVVVACLHWASYLGGACGLVLAILDARRRRRRLPAAA